MKMWNILILCLVVVCRSTSGTPYLKIAGDELELVELQVERPDGAYVNYIRSDDEVNDEADDEAAEPMMSNYAREVDEESDEKKDIPLGIPEEDSNIPGEPLTPEDFKNAEKLEVLVPLMDENSRDPIESAGLFEGDIAGVNSSSAYIERNAIRNLYRRWPHGVIPYVISAAYDVYERSVIAAAFNDYHEQTCIRFVPRTTQRDYVHMLKGAGCSSNVGRSGRGQLVSLGVGCLYKGIVVHELMHATGFWHEQSRSDRDKYIDVLWRNIIPGMEFNFQKISLINQQSLGLPYDSDSVMHYGMFAFSRNYRLPTIVSRTPGTKFLGQRRGFSKVDLKKVNTLYECHKKPTLPPVGSGEKPTESCVDNNRFCAYWSRIGDCATNPTWMLVNCAKSCKQCDKQCADHNKHCAKWSQLGECTKNPDYMTIYCAKSCQACTGGTVENNECVNRNKYCTAWAKSGQCQVNPSYMLVQCRKACDQC